MQTADTKPGAYYVTACDMVDNAGTVGAVYLMLGPFIDDHATALACVDAVQALCNELDSTGRAWFKVYGTVRYDTPPRAGRLNNYFGLPLDNA